MMRTLLYLILFFTISQPSMVNAQTGQTSDANDLETKQKQLGLENWQRAFDDDDKAQPPTIVELPLLRIYAKLPEKELRKLGQIYHQEMAVVVKALELKRNDIWKGKLAIYLLQDRREFSTFVRRVERRRVFPYERSSISLDGDLPHIVVGPTDSNIQPSATDLSLAEQAGAELAKAMLDQKFRKDIPLWLRDGFGRATLLRVSPKSRQATERQAAQLLAFQKKLSASAAWSAQGNRDERELVAGSVVEFLAYSGLTQKFVPLLQSFRPKGDGNATSTDEALRAIGVESSRLNTAWKAWLQRSN